MTLLTLAARSPLYKAYLLGVKVAMACLLVVLNAMTSLFMVLEARASFWRSWRPGLVC